MAMLPSPIKSEMTLGKHQAYLNSKENFCLMPSKDFGRRKYFSAGQPSHQFSHVKNKSSPSNKQWMHPPEALTQGHIVYNVKFNKHLKSADGQKSPKVELTISTDGVTIQEPKYKVPQYQYPLHQISYCADDKSDKMLFTFIAKEADNNRHHCFVFNSEKCAEEITLTIGQAFDLAYKRFLETSGKDMDTKKQFLLMQKKVKQLTQENLELKGRCTYMERVIKVHGLTTKPNQTHSDDVVDRHLGNVIFADNVMSSHTNGISSVKSPHSNNEVPALNVDLFGAMPFNPIASQDDNTIPPSRSMNMVSHIDSFNTMAPSPGDPFGMGSFNPSSSDLDHQIKAVDKELLDFETGFKSGPTIFSLDDLDPLNIK